MAGDITGKLIIPLVHQQSGTYYAELGGVKRVATDTTELQKLQEDIMINGFYWCFTTVEELEELRNNPGKLEMLFQKLTIERLQGWMKLAEDVLKGSGIACYMNPGNDDGFFINDTLNTSQYIVNPDGKVVNLDNAHEMLTLGYSNMTPWKCPRDISEEELGMKIDALVSQTRDIKNCIFNLHCPPFDSGLDTAPKLDKNLTVDQFESVPVGSSAVRKAIEKYQPMLGLHGHIHESRGHVKIGRTLCINPGSEYGEGVLRGALINLSNDRIRSHLLLSG